MRFLQSLLIVLNNTIETLSQNLESLKDNVIVTYNGSYFADKGITSLNDVLFPVRCYSTSSTIKEGLPDGITGGVTYFECKQTTLENNLPHILYQTIVKTNGSENSNFNKYERTQYCNGDPSSNKWSPWKKVEYNYVSDETITLSAFVINGILTGGGKNMWFTIPISRSISGTPSINITNLQVRHVSGGYIFNTGSGHTLDGYDVAISDYGYGLLKLVIASPEVITVCPNNTPIAAHITCTITMS